MSREYRDTLSVAALQMVSRTDDEKAVDDNLQVAASLVSRAAEAGAELAVLPENVLTFGQRDSFSRAEQLRWLQRFSELAKQHQLWLVAGSLPLQAFIVAEGGSLNQLNWAENDALPFSTSVVFNSAGDIAGVYRKMHLFDAEVNDSTRVYRESDYSQAGDAPVAVETPWGLMGLGICYDLRFPEFFRRLSAQGMRYCVLPSAFTYITGAAHWALLLRARAVENQCFMVGVDQGGEHGRRRKTWGESMIVDGWGDVLVRAGDALAVKDSQLGEHLLIAELNFTEQEKLRQRMPVLRHRRLQ